MRLKRQRMLLKPLILVITLNACTTVPETESQAPPAMMLCSGAPSGCVPVPAQGDAWQREPDRAAPFGPPAPPAPVAVREPAPRRDESYFDQHPGVETLAVFGSMLLIGVIGKLSGGGGTTCQQSHLVTHKDPASGATYQTSECN
jgi:hypothetical protein